ncbi:MAG: carbohydrate binding domain-containing protein [Candidatus Auribacterota bacterium]|nr:carbohydrate binding domain-containing protein [Candidatus Auribacterota bacterium]
MLTLPRDRGIVTGALTAAIILLTIFVFLPGILRGQPIAEGFDNFDTGTRPSGWTFNGCNANSDTYTVVGDYGVASPSIKLDLTGDYIQTETLFHPDQLQFWVKGMGTDASSALLVEEYYSGSGWNTLTNVVPLPVAGTNFGPYSMEFLATEARFTYTKSTGDLAFDDVGISKAIPTPTVTPSAPPTATTTLTPPPTATPTPLNNFYNPSFELDPALTGWSVGGSSTERSSEQAYDGTYSCKFTNPTYDYAGRSIKTEDSVLVPVVPDKEYIFSGWFYVLFESGNIDNTLLEFDINWMNGTEVVYTDSNVGWSNNAFDQWEKKEYTETAPSNADGVRVYIACRDEDGHNVNNDVYVDLFNVARAPEIFINKPDEDSVWFIGVTENITWTSVGVSSNLDIDYTTNGTDWAGIATNIPDSGTHAWTVQTDPSKQAQIRVQETGGGGTTGESDQFTIAERNTIVITSPAGGETWYRTVSYNITWSVGPDVGPENVDLDYSTDNGSSWTSIDTGVGVGSSPYPWTIPDEDSTNCLVRVTQSSSGISGQSPAVFTIASPTFTVTSPAGGEVWYWGDLHPITWTSTAGITGNVNIDYSTAGVSGPWFQIAANEDNDGSFSSWTIPNVNTTTARVRISEIGGISIPGISDNDFNIVGTSPPSDYVPLVWTEKINAETEQGVTGFEAYDTDNMWLGCGCGLIYYYDGTTWQLQQDTCVNIEEFVSFAADDVFGTGTSGRILHYNGSHWSLVFSGEGEKGYAIDGSDPDHVIAGTAGGEVNRYNYGSWTNQTVTSSGSFTGVAYLKPNQVFILNKGSSSSDGAIYLSTDGTTWSEQKSVTGGWAGDQPLDGCIDQYGNSLLWMVGSCGQIEHYNGSYWSMQTVVGYASWKAVVVLDENNVWASGNHRVGGSTKGIIIHYDGSDWHVENTDFTTTLYRLSVVDNRHIYGTGSSSSKIYQGLAAAASPTPWISVPPTPDEPTPTRTPVPVPGPISGRVYDRETDIGIANLYVRALPTESGLTMGGALTDAYGNYTVSNLDAGLYDMFVDSNQGSGVRVYRNQWYNQKDYQHLATAVGSNSTVIDFPLYKQGVYPTPISIPSPTPDFQTILVANGDYSGDGYSDIAVFRESSGLWAVRAVTRLYFGSTGDIPISGDYDGDGTADIGIFRSASGLWAIRDISRTYFGTSSDLPVPGDYDGDGFCDIGIFRDSSGLWAIKDLTRSYFGASSDQPVPADYDGDGQDDIGVFRGSSGLWALKDVSRIYYGSSADTVVPGDYVGTGTAMPGIYRPSSGLWSIRTVTRIYFGSAADQPVPFDFTGAADISIFRPSTGLWAINGVTRVYYGSTGDLPATR